MARTFALGALVTRAQQICDAENQGSPATTEWKGFLSSAYAELYSVLVASGMRYFESTETITANGSTSYALPADHLSTIGVDFVVSSATGERRELRELMAQERNIYSGLTGEARAYALVGSNIELYPVPASGSYKHVYVPQPTDLSSSADGTSVDVVTPDGELFLVWSAAVLAKTKEESDLGPFLAERRRALERIEEWATLRSLNTPRRRIVEEDGYDDCYPYDRWIYR